jgi:hypothetical protein
MRNLIKADSSAGPFLILNLEQQFAICLPLTVNGITLDLKVGGMVDRVDLYQDRIRIVDYKTGTLKNTFSSVPSLFDSRDKMRNDAVFQVLVYAMVYSKLHPGHAVVPSLCFVRGSHADNFTYGIQYKERRKLLESYDEVREEFEALLGHHLSRMFNTGDPFAQTSNLKTCLNCPYAVICRREGVK